MLGQRLCVRSGTLHLVAARHERVSVVSLAYPFLLTDVEARRSTISVVVDARGPCDPLEHARKICEFAHLRRRSTDRHTNFQKHARVIEAYRRIQHHHRVQLIIPARTHVRDGSVHDTCS